jgi:hypothetical protein
MGHEPGNAYGLELGVNESSPYQRWKRVLLFMEKRLLISKAVHDVLGRRRHIGGVSKAIRRSSFGPAGCPLLIPIANQTCVPWHANYFTLKTSRGLPEASQFSVTVDSGTIPVER